MKEIGAVIGIGMCMIVVGLIILIVNAIVPLTTEWWALALIASLLPIGGVTCIIGVLGNRGN